ncbi:O-acetyl-ADP-ribose deacetylase [Panacibacter sp. DH6]|uniref:O-acetyl-ADP-ribose deacetylase n=2 Tax=Panacibacter microcysteis TaxID=2793269 RepID=A0A931E7K5_9BACT|nr:O-acetyl-ADP-ribose deacetylase [Panacibacter microcysteis]
MAALSIIHGDITKQKVDAIVNAANSSLLGGGGVDGAIHRAGGPAILAECVEIRNRQGGCKTGEAVITNAGRLPSKKVIHTVGPVWKDGTNNEEGLLYNCYVNSLHLAVEHALLSIAFPNISTGIYGYPKVSAANTAIRAVRDFTDSNFGKIKAIVFVCFDEENYELYTQILEPAS